MYDLIKLVYVTYWSLPGQSPLPSIGPDPLWWWWAAAATATAPVFLSPRPLVNSQLLKTKKWNNSATKPRRAKRTLICDHLVGWNKELLRNMIWLISSASLTLRGSAMQGGISGKKAVSFTNQKMVKLFMCRLYKQAFFAIILQSWANRFPKQLEF